MAAGCRTGAPLLVAAVSAAWLGVVTVVALHRPPWGGERHYVETTRTFGRDLSVETLRSYGELTPPLAFVLYARWGRLVGFDLARLRLLSPAIAFLTVMAVYVLARRVLRDDRDAVLAALFFLVHPYTIGLSVFVFTDMLAILCAVSLAIGIAAGHPVLVVLGSAAGLMTRQYFAFLTATAALYCAIRWARRRRAGDLALLAGLLGSCLPLVGMMLLWRGLGPASATRALYLSNGLSFHPPSLSLYVGQLFTYLCPLPWAERSGRGWACVGALSLVYWLAPVCSSPPQVAVGIGTIGLLHRGVRATVGRLGPAAEGLFFWLAFGLGLSVRFAVVRDVLARRDVGWPDARTFLGLAVLCFLAVMPFSYLHWEKYFMPLLAAGRRARPRDARRPASCGRGAGSGLTGYIRRSATSRLRWTNPMRA
jgi:hypothetical protein